MLFALLCATLIPLVSSHGQMTWPPSRNRGSLAAAGHCDNDACQWFSQPTAIPADPTLPHHMRTYNVDVKTGEPGDWSATMPWRSPGASPVQGSGCGVGGGNPVFLPNGGGNPDWPYQGLDGLKLPELDSAPVVWASGSVQEVGFGILANHGGGYSYRLCPADGVVNEECFQKTVLKFEGNTHEIRHGNQTFQYSKMLRVPGYHIPRLSSTEGTYPRGSEWARVPIPGCKICDQSSCGPGLFPNVTDEFESDDLFLLYHLKKAPGGKKWFEQQVCAQTCSGFNVSLCPPGMLQFDEPVNGISGYTNTIDANEGFAYSVVDKVKVPDSLRPGNYLLSWRWDCEQSHQIWQNCADIRITDDRQEHAVTPLLL